MKRFGVVVLVGLATTSLANAQEWPQFSSVSDPEVVRAGVFAERDATLAQGATATVSATLDVDGDGRDDELLVVTPPSHPDELAPNPALVLARHVANGWSAEVVERNNDVVNTFVWRAPLRLDGVVFLVVESVEVDRDEHTSTLSVTLLRARSPRGVEPAHEIRDANARSLALSVVGERGVLVTRNPARYRLLTWDGTRFTATAWARRRPAAPR